MNLHRAVLELGHSKFLFQSNFSAMQHFMPTVFRDDGVRFSFFSDEGEPREPVHIHAFGPNGQAKIWLFPTVKIAYSAGFTAREQTKLMRTVEARRELIMKVWNEHFG